MQKIKNKDFVELEYTGIVKETGMIFDTTDKKLAQENGIHNPNIEYAPAIICVGQNQLIANLDAKLVDKELNKEYEIELGTAFGMKDAKLLKFVSKATFKKKGVDPQPGMQVQIDNNIGTIRTISGGRILVDFNHPLATKDIIYKVKPLRILEDDEEKVKQLIKLELRIKPEHTSFKDGKVIIDSKQEVPKEFTDILTKRIQEMVPAVKEMEFKLLKETPKTTESSP